MAKRAILITKEDHGMAQSNIMRILDFFGVPWEAVQADKLPGMGRSLDNAAVIGPIDAVAAATKVTHCSDGFKRLPEALFAFTGTDRVESETALQSMCGDARVSFVSCATGVRRICVSREKKELAGPMAGLDFTARIGEGASALAGAWENSPSANSIITVDGDSAFVRFKIGATSMFFSANGEITDIDEPVRSGYFDVKDHFLAAVPLVMFIKSVFWEIAWREQELGACLIVDDPLLKPRYGRCDFRTVRDSMRQYGFTTNISFIPWNWRRTSRSAAQFFKEAQPFSVSIHGCDHTKSEFGDTSLSSLQGKARLAMSRMEDHEARTGIHHDRIMIFPQGVFSSMCPEVLKRSGYTAAVNTEIIPVDIDGQSTRIRDVWDVAITRYGDFPIFTRRYAHHGLENFAFDLLLGKPCLIVSHHEFFKDDCKAVVDLVEKLRILNCNLEWRSLGEVVRRACRLRMRDSDRLEVQMYGTDLLVKNPVDEEVNVLVLKWESNADTVGEVLSDRGPIEYSFHEDQIVVRHRLEPQGEMGMKVRYKASMPTENADRPLAFKVSVALRRILSEVRDEYLT